MNYIVSPEKLMKPATPALVCVVMVTLATGFCGLACGSLLGLFGWATSWYSFWLAVTTTTTTGASAGLLFSLLFLAEEYTGWYILPE